ncbi:hypothetical protein CSAL01_01369 [Colletotrichum salicis]|uniref:2EXR domain-containing protein n=1 Tax=Colletotrichum salicis TaxID=1209931 RepID=A0A135V367_9PEZI|nr:hypothetical protein CSAL01_01369 [Colletotrichum salicis]
MDAAHRFTLFGALPPELRLQIWTEALSVSSVWSADRKATETSKDNTSHLPPIMTHIGPAPYLAGLACKESRRLLERLYAKPIHGPRQSAASGAVHWIDLQNTVVSLGDHRSAGALLDSFPAEDLARFRHVVLQSSQFSDMARLCQRLANSCSGLRTIIIHTDHAGCLFTDLPCEPLTQEMAAIFVNILDDPGAGLNCNHYDIEHFRSLLLGYFADSPPTLHFASPYGGSRQD